jgi:hypothetical protein
MKRTCRDCGECKDSTLFVKNKVFKCGIDTLCLSCNRKRVKKYRAEGKRNSGAEALRYYKKYPEKGQARAAKRRAYKRTAFPSWANEFFMEEAYHLAYLRTKCTGFSWHVDHIVPLKSPIVCGLHVENNLQVIPAVQNIKKGNRHVP